MHVLQFFSALALLVLCALILGGAYLGHRDESFYFDKKDRYILGAVGCIAVSQIVVMLNSLP